MLASIKGTTWQEDMGEQLDLFSQLSEDQQREIIERWAVAEYRASHGIAARPESRFTGQFVRFQRQMWGWKKETLASFADVSLSTIERIERGDRVGDDCLDRVAVALGYKRGDFTVFRSQATRQSRSLSVA